jgi:hypothetical protein
MSDADRVLIDQAGEDRTAEKHSKLDPPKREALFVAIGAACRIEEGASKPRLVVDPERFIQELEKIGWRIEHQ